MCASKIQILSILLRSSKHCSVWRWNCMYLYKHIDNLPNMILNVATLNNTIINRSVDIDSYRLKVAHTSNTHLVSHILKMQQPHIVTFSFLFSLLVAFSNLNVVQNAATLNNIYVFKFGINSSTLNISYALKCGTKCKVDKS